MKHFVVGLITIILGVWGMIVWWRTFGIVMRGVVPIGLVIFGLVAIMSGYRRISVRPRVYGERRRFDGSDEDVL